MSTLHEDTLRNALHDAAGRYEVPPAGAEQILETARRAATRARSDDDGAEVEPARSRNRRRIVLVAAVAVVLVALASALSLATLGAGPYRARVTSGALLSGHALAPRTTAFGLIENGLQVQSAAAVARAPASGNRVPNPAQQTKVVSVGAIALTVPAVRFNDVVARLSNVATGVGGYVSSSKVTGGAQGPGSSGVVELRIPQKQFGSVVAKVERMGHVVSVVTNSTDVTGQYVDYQSRIGALQASRSQYLAIMARASSINDILAIQAQVNVIETQIEQLEGQRNLLVNQAAYGTLSVAINQGLVVGHPSGVHKAWTESISGFVSGVEWLIRAGGPALFALLCLAVLLFLGRFGWRASQRRLI